MASFVTERDLTKRIRYVVGGSDVKCAVAYWGNHGFDLGDVKNWKIVCDIVGGSTSPTALTALGAPTNSNLKHYSNLHSKVYLSDRGAVIGSANASAGGLHTMDRSSRMLEAGVYYDSADSIWRQATAWFDQLFESAEAVDEDAVKLAQARYRPPYDEIPKSFEGMPVLQQIMSNPAHFADARVGFVICRNSSDAEVAQAAKDAARAGGISAAELESWEPIRSFTGWSKEDMANLNDRFVEFYIGPRGGNRTVLMHQLARRFDKVSDDDKGHFYTSVPDREICLPDGNEFPTGKEALSESEWDLLLATEKVNSDEGGIWGAVEFSQMLRSAVV